MLDIKQQKVVRENMAQEDSAFTEVSGLEVRVHPGKPHSRDGCFPIPCILLEAATYLAPQTPVQEARDRPGGFLPAAATVPTLTLAAGPA